MKTPPSCPSPVPFAGATSHPPSLPMATVSAAKLETIKSEAAGEPGRHSLFQIAAQMEIPGLPRITIRRLMPNKSTPSESAPSKMRRNKLADDFKSSRSDQYKPEHKIWAAALSLSL